MNNSIINNFVDSFIAFLFAISGPVAIMLSITSTNNIDPRDVSIWLFGCFAVNGFFSIILTLKNKQPLVLMWSIPGIILIGYSLKNYSLNDYASVREQLPNLKKKWDPWNTIAAWYLWCDIDPVPFVY